MFGPCSAADWPTPWRKRSLLVCAVLFLFGALVRALAPTVHAMVVARSILGLAVGAVSATVPLFLAEMPPAYRPGRMGIINKLMIVTGQLLAFVVNAIIDASSVRPTCGG
jgi:major inositol transporter-like SP family MFS transporter